MYKTIVEIASLTSTSRHSYLLVPFSEGVISDAPRVTGPPGRRSTIPYSRRSAFRGFFPSEHAVQLIDKVHP